MQQCPPSKRYGQDSWFTVVIYFKCGTSQNLPAVCYAFVPCSAPLHASGGSRHSVKSLCRVGEDEEDPLLGDFESCPDTMRDIFPEHHAPAHVRPQEAVRAAATSRSKQVRRCTSANTPIILYTIRLVCYIGVFCS
jgi:hypothetical protein